MIDWKKKNRGLYKKKNGDKRRRGEKERKWDLKLKVLTSNLSLYFNRLVLS
jgi:hypothetical protein